MPIRIRCRDKWPYKPQMIEITLIIAYVSRKPTVSYMDQSNYCSAIDQLMTLMQKTYEIEKNAPPPMSWDEYETKTLTAWDELLSGPEAGDEGVIHRFLEQNPSFIPGAFSFPASGHSPVFGGVFSKPPLTGIGTLVPDFMWIATATDLIYPVLIEIETPEKKWFTKKGQPTAEWTQARSQIIAWKQWLNNAANKAVFIEQYGPSSVFRHFEIKTQFVLVFGRRKEFDINTNLRGARSHQQGHDEFHITFDRLRPDYNTRNYLSLKKSGDDVIALVVPPTIRLGPGLAPDLHLVKGRKEAALREDRMSKERREFVARRFSYWDEWSKGSTHFYDASDSE